METTASGTAEKAASRAEEAVDKMKESAQEARREARRGLRKSADFIREHPRQTALGAVGLGIALAQLPRRFLAAGLMGLMGLILALLKPAALLYAGMKLGRNGEFNPDRAGRADRPAPMP